MKKNQKNVLALSKKKISRLTNLDHIRGGNASSECVPDLTGTTGPREAAKKSTVECPGPKIPKRNENTYNPGTENPDQNRI